MKHRMRPAGKSGLGQTPQNDKRRRPKSELPCHDLLLPKKRLYI